MNFSTTINGGTLEYIDAEHLYFYDGILLPSITQIVRSHYPNIYSDVPPYVLAKAARKGTLVHEAIERYYTTGESSDFPEVASIIALQDEHKFEVVGTEVPLVLFRMDEPVAAGRCDMVLMQQDKTLAGADIKRTKNLDMDYLFYQLNLYRIAYRQCYRREWKSLKGFHLRDKTREIVDIPIDEAAGWTLIEEFMEAQK